MKKELLFSITKKDLEITYYASSKGPGGQNVNKRATAVRIKHKDSGAIGKSNTHRTQNQNLKEAFNRLVNTKEFKIWIKMESAVRLQGFSSIKEKVNDLMKEENIKTEIFKNGKWIDETK